MTQRWHIDRISYIWLKSFFCCVKELSNPKFWMNSCGFLSIWLQSFLLLQKSYQILIFLHEFLTSRIQVTPKLPKAHGERKIGNVVESHQQKATVRGATNVTSSHDRCDYTYSISARYSLLKTQPPCLPATAKSQFPWPQLNKYERFHPRHR